MSYEEMEYLNKLTAERREQACRREWRIHMAVQWGGWIVSALILMANLIIHVY